MTPKTRAVIPVHLFGQPIFGLFKSGALERVIGRFVIHRAAQLRDRLKLEHAPERFRRDMRECFETLLGMAPAVRAAAVHV